jgi:uncharacterized protein with beta-barrel porin domain
MLAGEGLTVSARTAWAHNFSDEATTLAAFQSLPGSDFVLAGGRPGRDAALLGLEMVLEGKEGLSYGIALNSRLASRSTTLWGSLNLAYRW